MKRKKTGFTMVEILTVVGIIAILVAVLIPALTMVRRIAKETQQKAQLTAIDLALIAFKADYGDYPPSDWPDLNPPRNDYCGAQKLAEALLGWDLLGFHPKSAWRSDGRDEDNALVYDLAGTDEENEENLRARRGPYLEFATTNAFRLDDLYTGPLGTGPLAPDTFVICDVFGTKKIILAGGKTVRAGTPILYYRADTSKKTIDPPVAVTKRIYNVYDNLPIVNLKWQEDRKKDPSKDQPPLMDPGGMYSFFYEEYIRDPKITAMKWPYRPDSYILISAGADGLYGTSDDICNF